ncbi:uncharacterized protein LOC134726781 [Mytilus trossulus]|uniref:uncharacterized protein LOC134726781 n=1 Tax=Mytilus trossulus TaxID=6551 RepID=UPI0030075D5F
MAYSQTNTRSGIAVSKQVKVNINLNSATSKVSIGVTIATKAREERRQEIQPSSDAEVRNRHEPPTRDNQRTSRFIWKELYSSTDPRNMDIMIKNIEDENFGIPATD